jgi:hypothetical protein
MAMFSSGGVFEARYHGPCAECADRIEPGDDVVYVADELVHLRCSEQEKRPQPKVCQRCFLAHAGDCF